MSHKEFANKMEKEYLVTTQKLDILIYNLKFDNIINRLLLSNNPGMYCTYVINEFWVYLDIIEIFSMSMYT